MDWPMILKVSTELGALRFAGRIGLHGYNEPLMDRRLPRIVSRIRDECPRAYIYLSTNGDLLRPDNARNLIDAGIDRIDVMQYDGAIAPNVAEIVAAPDCKGHVLTHLRPEDTLTNSRGGAVKHLIPQTARTGPCPNVEEQIVIDAHGRVLICCNDYYAKYVMGNLDDQTLAAIWDSPTFACARESVRANDGRINLCGACQ